MSTSGQPRVTEQSSWDVWFNKTSSLSSTAASTSFSSSPAATTSASAVRRSRCCVAAASTSLSTVATMPHKKAPCYGSCPSQDEFHLLRCTECDLLMKPIAYIHHMNTKHDYHRQSSRAHYCSTRSVSEEVGTESKSSVFNSPELNAVDDFDAILLSPLSTSTLGAHQSSSRVLSPITTKHSPVPASSTHSTPAIPSKSRNKKNLYDTSIQRLPTDDSAKLTRDSYYVKQRGDLVIKFSKVDSIQREETTPCGPRSRNRRKQALKTSPSLNGESSPVMKCIVEASPRVTHALSSRTSDQQQGIGDTIRTQTGTDQSTDEPKHDNRRTHAYIDENDVASTRSTTLVDELTRLLDVSPIATDLSAHPKPQAVRENRIF
jgi:hypothetical protein